jgi:hypothetical protein
VRRFFGLDREIDTDEELTPYGVDDIVCRYYTFPLRVVGCD